MTKNPPDGDLVRGVGGSVSVDSRGTIHDHMSILSYQHCTRSPLRKKMNTPRSVVGKLNGSTLGYLSFNDRLWDGLRCSLLEVFRYVFTIDDVKLKKINMNPYG
jgi:hypothetical protein